MDFSVLLVYHDAMTRTAYPSDVSDEEWAFVAPSVTLMDEAAPQRNYPLRDVSNGLRSLLRTGALWGMLPNDFPPWHVVYQQTQRWLKAGVFEQMVHDLRMLLRDITDRSLSLAPLSWTAGRSRRRQKAGNVPATMGIHGVTAQRCVWLWIRWGRCWRFWSRQPTNKTGRRWRRWRSVCRR